MADQLYLSYWLRGFTANNMLRHFERMLRLFPFSPQPQGQSLFQVQPIDFAEPPLIEQAFEPPVEIAAVLAVAREFQAADSAYKLETWWDLWHYEEDQAGWKLQPARVSLWCYGPEFQRDLGEDLRIEFGVDAHFLPQPDLPKSLTMTQSNIKGLLRLVHELDDALTVEKRHLWSESGENFAERLREVAQMGQ